jgi:hypothetical protein
VISIALALYRGKDRNFEAVAAPHTGNDRQLRL